MLAPRHGVHDRLTTLAKIVLCGAILGATLWAACVPDPCPSLEPCVPHDMRPGCADGGTDGGCAQTGAR